MRRFHAIAKMAGASRCSRDVAYDGRWRAGCAEHDHGRVARRFPDARSQQGHLAARLQLPSQRVRRAHRVAARRQAEPASRRKLDVLRRSHRVDVQAASGREVSRRQPVHRRRRRVHDQPHQGRQHLAGPHLHQARRQGREGRRPHRPVQAHTALRHLPPADQLREPDVEDLLRQGRRPGLRHEAGRHRPLQDGPLGQGRPDGARGEPGLLARRAGDQARDAAADPVGSLARGCACLG